MKRILISVFAVMAMVVSANAQDDLKAGSVSIEVQFRPANATPISMDNFRARYFLSDNMAVRLGVYLNSDKASDEQMSTGNPVVTQTENHKVFTFGVYPGIEMHFPVGQRLSPYVGAELGFTSRSASSEITNFGFIEGLNISTENMLYGGSNEGYTSFGVNAITGMDFYIYRGLYMGVELGLGYSTYKEKDRSMTEVNGGTTNTVEEKINERTSSFGFRTENAIRLGWKF